MDAQESSSMSPAERRLRAVAALVSPTLLGIFVVYCVVTGEGVGDLVATSEIVSSVALVVGAVLILGSSLIYVRYPENYEDLQQGAAEQLQALIEQTNAEADAARAAQKQQQAEGADRGGRSD
jgi:hypothetical protein